MIGGWVIGDTDGIKEFLKKLGPKWICKLKTFTTIAEQQLQVVYAALVKSLQNEWSFTQRVISGGKEAYEGKEKALSNIVLPAIFECEVSGAERRLSSRMGGLGIRNPTEECNLAYEISRRSSDMILKLWLKSYHCFSLGCHWRHVVFGLEPSQVKKELIVREADPVTETPALVAVLVAVRGVWMPQELTLIDVRVIDTDANSYSNKSPQEGLRTAEIEKKRKHGAACEARRAAFTPFCVLVDELLGKEAQQFLKRLADDLARKWEKQYSETMEWIRARLSFAVLRASILCLRGSRTKWRCLRIEDGAPITWLLN